jgi:hypothetical protein
LADLAPGDVLAFSGTSCTSRIIRCCTLGSISHVGIVAKHPDPTCYGLRLYESVMPGGVRRIHLSLAVKTALDGGARVWHYPLAEPLSPAESASLTAFLEGLRGTPYDRIGAIRARTLGFGWVRWTRLYNLLPNREDLGNLFCSECVGISLRYLDRFHTRNASKWSPVALCWALVERGHCPGPVELRLPA